MAADLAEFYGFNPWQLDPLQAIGLWAMLPQAKAKRRMREMNTHKIGCDTADEAFDLVMAATQDQELAEHAWHEFRRAELRSGITPKD